MRRLISSLKRSQSGQALVESALILPLLITVVFNAANLGVFFLVALNVAGSPRTSATYAVMGYSTPSSPANVPAVIPATTATSVANLAYEDMRGALASYTTSSVQVCSQIVGLTNIGTATQRANCRTCTGSTDGTCTTFLNTYTPLSDPESPAFVLHSVDVTYTFTPLFPGTAFTVALLPTTLCAGGTCKFHRQASFRSMN